jgi:uncharacterized membrane protein
MLAILSESFRLFATHFRLLAAIILSVALPGNLAMQFLAQGNSSGGMAGANPGAEWSGFLWMIVAPISSAAVVYALSEITSGRPATYRESMAVGFRNWGRLFGATFIADLYIALGLIALIVPGLILLVRYALLDPVVVLEGQGITASRARSTALTAGRRWPIFWVLVVLLTPYILLGLGANAALGALGLGDSIIAGATASSLIEIAACLIQIAMFLFYREAVDNP